MFANLAYPLFLAIALRLLWLAKKTHTGRHWLVAAPSLAILFHKQHTHTGSKAESRLNFELLRPTGLVLYNNKYTILYSSSLLDSYYTQPDSNRAANLYITTKYMFSYIINLKCSDQYSKIIVTIIVKESFVNVNTVVVCLFTARVPQSHNNNNNNNKKLQDFRALANEISVFLFLFWN